MEDLRMKKCYKLLIDYDDELEEVEGLSETLEEIEAEGTWIDNGEMTLMMPDEISKLLQQSEILGIT
jgi:hypothetical protein